MLVFRRCSESATRKVAECMAGSGERYAVALDALVLCAASQVALKSCLGVHWRESGREVALVALEGLGELGGAVGESALVCESGYKC